MNRKLTAWILTLAMLVSLGSVLPVSAQAAESPVFTAEFSHWLGGVAAPGDTVFYIEATGTIPDGYSAVVGTYEGHMPGNAFTAVATQTGHWQLGPDRNGQDRHVYQMTMDGGVPLKDTDENHYIIYYYFRLTADDGATYVDSTEANPELLLMTPYLYLNSVEIPTEISAATTEPIPYSFEIDGTNAVSTPDDVIVTLCSGTKENAWADPTITGTVATSEDVALTVLGNGRFSVTGTFVPTALTKDTTLYMKVACPGADPAYSRSGIRVLGPNKPGQFTLSSAVAGRDSYDYHEGGGSSDSPADGSTFYLAGGLGETVHTFMITGVGLTTAAALTVTGGTLIPGSLVVTSAYGINTITGGIRIPASATALTFSYQSQELYRVPLERTSLLPGTGKYATSVTVDSVAENGAVTLTFSGFNLPTNAAAYTASIDMDDPILFTCTALAEQNGVLTLTLTPDCKLSGAWRAELLVNGASIPLVGYNSYDGISLEDGGSAGFFAQWSDSFIADPGSETHALLGIAGSQSLTLYGVGFSSANSYTAHLLPHTLAGLSATPITLAASYRSSTELTIPDTLTDGIARGWYEVYLTAGDIRVAGFADVALLPKPDGPVVENPTVQINAGAVSTTDQTVAITMTPGSFSEVRFAEDKIALASAPWRLITTTNYRLSDGYGKKTLYFEFRNADTSIANYSTTASISFRSSTLLPPPSEYGVVGVTAAGGTTTLYLDTPYTLYLKYAGSGFVGQAVILDAEGAPVGDSITLKRTGQEGENSIYTKTATLPLTGKSLRFSLVDGSGVTTDTVDLPILVQDRPFLLTTQAPVFPRTYSYLENGMGFLVPSGAEFQFQFHGTPGKTASATIQTSGAADVVFPLTEDTTTPGLYSGSGALPISANKLNQVVYTLTDGVTPATRTFSYPDHSIAPKLTFTGLDASYNETRILLSDGNWGSRIAWVSNGTAVFENLILGRTYSYLLVGENGTLATGSLTVNGQVSVDLSTQPKLTSLAFTPDANTPAGSAVFCSYTLGGVEQSRYIDPNTALKQLPVGLSVSYSLALPYEAERKIRPFSGTKTLAEGENTVAIQAVPYAKVTVEGTLTNQVTGTPVSGASVTAQQSVGNEQPFIATGSTYTDENGFYTLTLYKDVPCDLVVSCNGYRTTSLPATCQADATLDAALPYDTTNKVTVDLLVYPLAEGDAPFAEPVLQSNESLRLLTASTDGTPISGAYYSWGSSDRGYTYFVRLSQEEASQFSGKTISLAFSAPYQYVLEDIGATVKLNSDSTGHVSVRAYHKGILRGSVAGLAPSYMLVFNSSGYRVGQPICGTLSLSSEELLLNSGDYTVVVLRGDGLSRLSGITTLGAFDSLVSSGLLTSEHYTRRDATVVNGRVTDLSDLSPTTDATNAMLGAIDAQITTEPTPAMDGERFLNFGLLLSAPEGATAKLKEVYLSRNFAPQGADTGFYCNAKKIYGTDLYAYYPFPSSGTPVTQSRFTCALGVNDATLTVNGEVRVTYTLNGVEFQETFPISETVEKLTLQTPATVPAGEAARTLELNGIAKSGETISIYDGNTLLGTVTAEGNRYRTVVSLTTPDAVRSHTLRAIQGTNTATATCSVYERDSISYVSDFTWIHHNTWMQRDLTITLSDLSKLNSAALQTLSYYPSAPSTLQFKINGFSKDEIGSVFLVNNYNGHETPWPATCVDSGEGWSIWSTGKIKLSYTGKLSVRYDLATNDEDAAYRLMGATKPSVSELLNTSDPASLLDSGQVAAPVRDHGAEDNFEIDQASSELSMVQNAGGLTVENNFKELPSDQAMTPEALEAAGYLKVVTQEGTLWVKQETTETEENGKMVLTMKRKVYLDQNLQTLLNSAPTPRAADAPARAVRAPGMLKAGATDTALKGIEWGGAITGAAELAGDLKGVAYVSEKFVRGVNILGAAGTVVKIAGGPSGKDPNALIQALKNIENSDTRKALAREIADYSALVNDIYISDCMSSSVMTGLGFATNTPLTKGAVLIGGLASGAIGSMTESELDLMWNSIALSIQSELQHEMLGREKEWREKEEAERIKKEAERLRLEAFLNSCSHLGHSWVDPDGVVTKEPTDTEPGVRMFTCSRCKKSFGILIDPLKKDDKGPGTEEEIPEINVIVDPSGYVFEGVEGNRVEGVSATVYQGDPLGASFVPWTDVITGQENPQTTTLDGRYGWDVPAGTWKVGFAAPGYRPAESFAMTVPPAHTEVNIGLLSTAAPTVTDTVIAGGVLELSFSGFLQRESVYDSANALSSIQVYDSTGAPVPGTISFPVEAPNTGYVAGAYQQDTIASKSFVRRAMFRPDASYIGGFRQYQEDGTTPETYRVVVSKTILSYAGVAMAADFIRTGLTPTTRGTLAAPSASVESGTYSNAFSVALTAAAGAEIYYTTDGSTPSEVATHYTAPIPLARDTRLRFIAVKLGAEASPITEHNYRIDTARAASPHASLTPGSYDKAQTLTLATNTPGADIYYTTDGSMPTPTARLRYTGAFTLSADTIVRAIAVQDGLAQSPVASFIYEIASGGGGGGGGGGGSAHVETEKPTETPWSNPFSDVSKNAWYYSAVAYVSQNGLFTGTSANTFRPDATMTRAMLVTVLYRLAKASEHASLPFPDVPSGMYYTEAVGWASDNGIVTGYQNGQFGPDDPITREQLATILQRYAKFAGQDVTQTQNLSGFSDESQISPWARDALGWAVARKLIQGKGNNRLDPTGLATRAEVAAILMRFAESSAK